MAIHQCKKNRYMYILRIVLAGTLLALGSDASISQQADRHAVDLTVVKPETVGFRRQGSNAFMH